MKGMERRAERTGWKIMRGVGNGECNGNVWRGEMTGWSKEGCWEYHVEMGE
jgi:hypothetical protein